LNGHNNAKNKPALTIQTKDGAATNAMTTTVKQAGEKHQEVSRRELVDKSSTVLCSSKSIHNIPGSGILSQLHTFTAAGYLEVHSYRIGNLNCEC